MPRLKGESSGSISPSAWPAHTLFSGNLLQFRASEAKTKDKAAGWKPMIGLVIILIILSDLRTRRYTDWMWSESDGHGSCRGTEGGTGSHICPRAKQQAIRESWSAGWHRTQQTYRTRDERVAAREKLPTTFASKETHINLRSWVP